MKKIMLSIVLIFILSFGYAQKPLPKMIVSKADTILTTLYWINPVDSTPKLDFGYRVVMQNQRFVQVDDNTAKKKSVIDTFYFVPVITAKLDKNNKPQVDTSGRQLTELHYNQIQNSFVLVDGGKDIISAVNKFYAKKPK